MSAPNVHLALDGTPGRLVQAKDVPRRYREERTTAWSVHTSTTYEAAVTGFSEERPPGSITIGGVRVNYANPYYNFNAWCWIPESFFDEERNEWGEVAP
jgi:hypothetical protein